jgi:hypothetical protein
MRCPHCQHRNREGARFCAACGSVFASPCPVCGTPPPGAAFCDHCGTPLSGTTTAATPPSLVARPQTPQAYSPRYFADKILTSRAALEGERMQVTVRFAAPERSLERPADREPDDAHPLLESVLERTMGAAYPEEGVVNEAVTAGGWRGSAPPITHVGYAARARCAGLRLQGNCWDNPIGPAVRKGSVFIRGEG